MKVILIEDEKASQAYLHTLLQQQFPQMDIVAIADNVPDAVAAIGLHGPDIVFLDVEIKLGSGFDVLAQTKEYSFEVVFTTAFSNFAIEAFRYHALDYLVKPLNDEAVIETTKRCIEKRKAMNGSRQVTELLSYLQQHAATQKTKLSIPTIDGIEFVDVADVVYGEAKGNYTDLCLKNGSRIMASRKLKAMEAFLPLQSFFRIHHSYIVNLQYVTRYHKGRGGYLVLQSGMALPVSSARKDAFLQWLGS